MKYIITILSTILFISFANAQNIVPNYSFEQDDSCPTNENTFSCIDWEKATSESPDYFNACDTAAVSIGKSAPWVGVPYNFIGHQNAYDGVAYVGINMYDASLPDYKEYLITNLPALEIDTVYKVTIHVSLADYCEFASDAMGVLFTTYGSPSLYGDTTIIKTPQIDYTSYGIISDTTNWITLSSTFIADSAYTSFIIGGFKSSSNMHIVAVNDSPSNPHNNSYYYIDAVVVEKLSSTTSVVSLNNSSEVNIYPNPFTDHATLTFNNPYGLNATFILFNTQGQIVQQVDGIVSNRLRIERNSLPLGFYYYQLRNEQNTIANGKIIIQ